MDLNGAPLLAVLDVKVKPTLIEEEKSRIQLSYEIQLQLASEAGEVNIGSEIDNYKFLQDEIEWDERPFAIWIQPDKGDLPKSSQFDGFCIMITMKVLGDE